jgi:uncharacterized protein with ParB-like and HNH nuclease domain
VKILEGYDYLTVDKMVDAWRTNTLRPNPDYQRGLAWSQRQRQLLVDSIFRRYPLPRFYFYRHESKSMLSNVAVETFDIVDGLQRIDTLDQYLSDDWP